ncbi:MAG: DinB family protein [Chitinophagales bacterium]|nr:DinB family protein [Chitinophagales bacterium]
MYNTIEDFFVDWRHETANTEKLFEYLSDEGLQQQVYSEGRTLARLAFHLSLTTAEMLKKMGCQVQDYSEELPDTAKELQNILNQVNAASITELSKQDNDWLEEKVPMYREPWQRKFGLSVLIRHHIHHRGQMTVLMRQARLKVPGLYGPAKEEWEVFGSPAME